MPGLTLAVEAHPQLCLRAFTAEFGHPLREVTVPPEVAALLSPSAPAPVPVPDDVLRGHIRDLLRHGGFKPTGRNKPSSEYLLRAAGEGSWPAINPVVDIGNTVSLHSGIPISVVDLGRARPPLRVGLAPPGAQFVFNASGQILDVGGLLGLHDGGGPCANAVKDAQRTKTDAGTTHALFLLWGHVAVRTQVEAAAAWGRDLLARAGARVGDVACDEECDVEPGDGAGRDEARAGDVP